MNRLLTNVRHRFEWLTNEEKRQRQIPYDEDNETDIRIINKIDREREEEYKWKDIIVGRRLTVRFVEVDYVSRLVNPATVFAFLRAPATPHPQTSVACHARGSKSNINWQRTPKVISYLVHPSQCTGKTKLFYFVQKAIKCFILTL